MFHLKGLSDIWTDNCVNSVIKVISKFSGKTVTIYIENVTPAETTYTVGVQNFTALEEFSETSPAFLIGKKGNYISIYITFGIISFYKTNKSTKRKIQ